MIARLVRTPFDREGWFFELKWDGFRCIAEKDRQGVRLYSRNQNDFKKRFHVIAEQISALDNVILDGEVCALDDRRGVFLDEVDVESGWIVELVFVGRMKDEMISPFQLVYDVLVRFEFF